VSRAPARGWRAQVPLALTGLRAALAPVLVGLALAVPPGQPASPSLRAAIGASLLAAFVSDVLDGVIARRLGIATPGLRRLDSAADSLFYLGAVGAAWHLHPMALTDRWPALAALGALELARYAFDLRKFGREASYHMWSSKLWGIALFAGFVSLLAFDTDGPAVSAAVWLGIVADTEGLLISACLPHWRSDVPTLWHARRIARAAAAGG